MDEGKRPVRFGRRRVVRLPAALDDAVVRLVKDVNDGLPVSDRVTYSTVVRELLTRGLEAAGRSWGGDE